MQMSVQKRIFFSCQQYERDILPDFFHRFLRLKAQAPEVSDEQAIMQAIKALCVSQLHSHLVRERPRTLEELYDEFANSAEQGYYISVSWASRESPQARTKAQGHSSTAKAKKAQQVSTHLTGKFTA
jgi:hypothetical protein